MWGQIKSHVPNLNVGKVFDIEMAAAAPMSFAPQLPSIQNFLVAVKVMPAGSGGGGGGGGGFENQETSTWDFLL